MTDAQHDDQARQQGGPPPGWYPDPAGGPARRWWDGTGWTHDLEPQGQQVGGAHPAQAGQQQDEPAPQEQQPASAAQPGSAPEHAPVVPHPTTQQPAGLPAYGQFQGAGQQQGSQPGAHQQQAQQYAQPWDRPQQQPLPEGTSVSTPWIWVIVVLPLVSLLTVVGYDWRGYMERSLQAPVDEPFASFDTGYVLISLASWLIYGVTVVLAWLDHRELRKRGVVAPFHWAWSFLSALVYVIGRTVVLRRRVQRGSAPLWAYLALTVVSIVVALVVVFSAVAAVLPELQGTGY